MRRATRWILTFMALTIVCLIIAGPSGGSTGNVAAAQPVKKKASATRLILRVQPPKPFHSMTLRELAGFQERALSVYVSRWRFWQTHRTRLLAEVTETEQCQGIRAPHWACWSLAASIWTRRELGETKAKLAAIDLRSMGMYDWTTAARYVQRVFPGTFGWLMSCSHGEGGHGRWVRYGGGAYYPGYELTDAVGGPMQFRPSTFYGYVDDAFAWARAHGLRLPAIPLGWDHAHIGAKAVAAWLNPLAQATTAAYMRGVVGNSYIHWSPSIDPYCS